MEAPATTDSHGVVDDPYYNASNSNTITKGPTGVCYDVEVLKHKCEWDDNYPENPQRLSCVLEK